MDAVADYTGQIDRLLSASCALFPGQPPAAPGAAGDPAQPTAPAPPAGAGGLATAAQQAGEHYRAVAGQIAQLTEALDRAVKQAAAQAIQAGEEARDIRDSVRVQVDAISEAADTSEGVGQLVSTCDERLGAMAAHIEATREQLRATAQQIRELSVELSATAATAARPG